MKTLLKILRNQSVHYDNIELFNTLELDCIVYGFTLIEQHDTLYFSLSIYFLIIIVAIETTAITATNITIIMIKLRNFFPIIFLYINKIEINIIDK